MLFEKAGSKKPSWEEREENRRRHAKLTFPLLPKTKKALHLFLLLEQGWGSNDDDDELTTLNIFIECCCCCCSLELLACLCVWVRKVFSFIHSISLRACLEREFKTFKLQHFAPKEEEEGDWENHCLRKREREHGFSFPWAFGSQSPYKLLSRQVFFWPAFLNGAQFSLSRASLTWTGEERKERSQKPTFSIIVMSRSF